jgi:hypothetical protein
MGVSDASPDLKGTAFNLTNTNRMNCQLCDSKIKIVVRSKEAISRKDLKAVKSAGMWAKLFFYR